jgi:transcriptional regulator with XRE-family HTH domain
VSDWGEPCAERRQLAFELRRLRDQAGISGRDMAKAIGMSQSKVSRIESGVAMPRLPEVEQWADATGASPGAKRSLLSLTERAFTEIHHWRTTLRARPHLQHELREREARTRVSRSFQPSVVPGLL